MICLLGKGKYVVARTPKFARMIIFEEGLQYDWVDLDDNSFIKLVSQKDINPQKILVLGKFRTYEVKNEPGLTNGLHLELFVGKGIWKSYILPTGFPEGKSQNRIITTDELITKQMEFYKENNNSASSF